MKAFLMLVVLIAQTALAEENVSTDFSRHDSEVKALTPEELLWRFHVSGEVFVLNSDGDKLINVASESREWQYGGAKEQALESNWQFKQQGLPNVALKQKWSLEADGRILVSIAQYDTMERDSRGDVKYGKLIKEEKITLKNFAPIDWPVVAGNKKVIVRLTPGIWSSEQTVDVSALPFSGKNIVIYDRTGKAWADQVTIDHPAVYYGITTHQGSVFFSFKSFQGAKLIGEAKGARIKIKNGQGGIYLQSETPFVPKDVKVNVYGKVLPQLRTLKFNSTRSYGSDREEEFLKAIPRQ